MKKANKTYKNAELKKVYNSDVRECYYGWLVYDSSEVGVITQGSMQPTGNPYASPNIYQQYG